MVVNDDGGGHHGSQFNLTISEGAEDQVKASFGLQRSPSGSWVLLALNRFDVEEGKHFSVPIVISEISTSRQSTCAIDVYIEHVNEHPMADAAISVLVYNYKDFISGCDIGRAFVQNEDHSDYLDKEYKWHPQWTPSPHFSLAKTGGFVTAGDKVPAGTHMLHLQVTDTWRQETADSTVSILVKQLTEEDILNSASLRLSGISVNDMMTAPRSGLPSRRHLLQYKISRVMQVAEQDVDIFSMFNNDERATVDIYYSVTGQATSVRINSLMADHRRGLQALLGARVEMFGIDDCLYHLDNADCRDGCTNRVRISQQPYRVFTSNASFVGVKVSAHFECDRPVCSTHDGPDHQPCRSGFCLNGGNCTANPVKSCRCRPGFEGPRCEGLKISFDGVCGVTLL